MGQFTSEAMRIAAAAKDRLVRVLLNHPSVTLIDIGPEAVEGTTQKRLVVRVHCRTAQREGAPLIPQEVNGVPVRVVQADYRLE